MRNRTLVLGAVVAVLTVAAFPGISSGTTPAGGETIHVSARVLDCVATGGGLTPNVDATLTVKRKSRVIVSGVIRAASNGTWAASWCTVVGGRIQVGDTLTLAENPAVARTVKVPDLTPTIKVVSDTISGRVPTGGVTEVRWYRCYTGVACDLPVASTPTTTAGAWTVDLHGSKDVRPGDGVDVSWTSAQGDIFSFFVLAPDFAPSVGSAKVTGHGIMGATVSVTLRSARGAIRATASTVVGGLGGRWAVTLRKGGKPVKVNAGDKLSSSVYRGARLTTIATKLVVDAGAGHVTGRCSPNATEILAITVGDLIGFTRLSTDPKGDFTHDLGGPIDAGTVVESRCITGSGNAQITRRVVP